MDKVVLLLCISIFQKEKRPFLVKLKDPGQEIR